MVLRRSITAVLIALVTLSGCGSDKASTTTDGDASGTDSPTTTGPNDVEIGGQDEIPEPATVDDDAFAEAIAPLRAIVDSGSDICEVLGILSATSTLPQPTGPAQMKLAVDLTADTFIAVGNEVATDNAEAGSTIVTLFGNMKTNAEAAGYPDDFLEADTTFSDPNFATAMGVATDAMQKRCPDAVGAGTEAAE